MGTDYTAWDRDEKLGEPPWNPEDPKVIAWERAHGHDVRLKCYPEFGCTLGLIQITADEAATIKSDLATLKTYVDRVDEWPCTAAFLRLQALLSQSNAS